MRRLYIPWNVACNSRPVKGLSTCLLMFVFSAQGLRANLLQLYGAMPEAGYPASTSGPRSARALYALATLHCLVLERRRFLRLGYNNAYDFSDMDFQARWLATTNLLVAWLRLLAVPAIVA